MVRRAIIVGLGELVYDHIFCSRGKELIYIGSHGGGSVFNILANVAYLGGNATVVGVGGDDYFGIAAKEELNYLGVDTTHLKLIPKRSTRLIFETIHLNSRGKLNEPIHTFSGTCPLCQSKEEDKKLAKINKQAMEPDLEKIRQNTAFLCLDRLTRERVEIAKDFRQCGIKTTLDIGRIGFMRYLPAPQIVSSLNNIDILLTPINVAESLYKRFGYNNIDELIKLLPNLLIYISKGKNGMNLYYNGIKREFAETPVAEVIDDAGAGDAFLAHVLRKLTNFDWNSNRARKQHDLVRLCNITKESIAELDSVLLSYGARGHLFLPETSVLSIGNIKGMGIEQIKASLECYKPCPFCNMPIIISDLKVKSSRQSKLKPGIKHNVGPLLLKRMFFVTERLEAIKKCQDILAKEGTAYIVGTGGSYPVAVFISILLGLHGKLFSQPIRPFDYARIGTLSSYVIVISYSGSTSDCEAVIKKATDLGVPNIVLVTGSGSPKLKRLLPHDIDDVISYKTPKRSEINSLNEPPRERGFISFSGTVSPCTLWSTAVIGSAEMTNLAGELYDFSNQAEPIPNLSELAKILNTRPNVPDETVSVLGGGWAWPAMLDFESKLVEGGLGKVQLHEIKDFSHGRFMSLMKKYKNSPVVLLGVGPWHEYEQSLSKTLEKGRLLIPIRSKFKGITGALELLVKIQFFVKCLGKDLGKDISRPKVPTAGLDLYRWKGLFENEENMAPLHQQKE
jgi:fructoselysine-6-P-deglycase FrlB-like protein